MPKDVVRDDADTALCELVFFVDDKKTLKGLKINLTCESEYIQNDDFFE